ncbi:MAG: S8 family serine peptidase [Leptolyngbya sp. SIOISBB]|nr:S8 family serine peptidase [Leptolyngbya sp. SIOISBB]
MNSPLDNSQFLGQLELTDSSASSASGSSDYTSNLLDLNDSTPLLLPSSETWLTADSLLPTEPKVDLLSSHYLSLYDSFEAAISTLGKLSDAADDSGFNQNDMALLSHESDALIAPQNNTFSTAQNVGTLVGARSFGGTVSASDTIDFFRFQLDTQSDLNLLLSGLNADADLYLMKDFNNNGVFDSGEIIDGSIEFGSSVEAISLNNLYQGEYFMGVVQYSGSTSYQLSASASPDGGLGHDAGSLSADSFDLDFSQAYSVFSGNGNVDFGYGYGDVLNLSNLSVNNVVGWNPVAATGGGVIYNPGNGDRAFDAMSLSSGHQILMEGLDGIWFQEGYYSFNSDVLPNDPMFSEQWNLHMMGVHNAWRFTQGSDDVLIGVQDTGLGFNNNGQLHADLDGSRTFGIASNIDDDFFEGTSSHGTAVHGIIGAAGNNGIGLAGINWNSDVAHLDVFGPDQFDLDEATSLMADYATSTGRRLVVNMSLGAHGAGFGAMPALEQLIAQNADNALFVIASGNDDDGFTSYPALLNQAYDNVMAVGASWGAQDWYGDPTEPGDRISYPGWWGSNYGYGLSLMGPSEVITTKATDSGWNTSFRYYQNAPAVGSQTPFNGTSAATPNVAGVASLVWSANPFLSAGEVHQVMQETAVDLGFPGYDYEFGAGFVNADAAVRRAMALRSSFQPGSAASDAVATTVLPDMAWSAEMGDAQLTETIASSAATDRDGLGEESLAAVSTELVDKSAAVLEAITLDRIELPTVQNRAVGVGTLAREGSDGAIAPETVALPQLAKAELAADSGTSAPRLEQQWALTTEANLLTTNLVQPLDAVLAAEVDALTGELVAAV